MHELKTAAEHTANAQAHAAAENESFDRCDTDGFLTQWSHGILGQVEQRKAEIAANGGFAEFPALFDLNGELVPAKLVRTYDRYKFCHVSKWRVQVSDTDETAIAWITPFPVRKSTMVKKGYTEGYVKAPANAKTWAPEGARGLSGAASVSVVTYRTDGGFSRDVEIVTTCRDYEKN